MLTKFSGLHIVIQRFISFYFWCEECFLTSIYACFSLFFGIMFAEASALLFRKSKPNYCLRSIEVAWFSDQNITWRLFCQNIHFKNYGLFWWCLLASFLWHSKHSLLR